VRKAVRIDEDLHLSIDPFATKPNWRTRWGGKITTINVKRDSGIHTVEFIASANREHLKTTLVGSNPVFPPEVQVPKMWMLPANIRTGCAITLFINWARQFFPALSIPTNIFNPAGWINPLGPDALLNLNPLAVADAGAVRQPVLDQSRTSMIAAAWNDFHTVTHDPLKDAGCTARVYTWLTEDEDTPHPELEPWWARSWRASPGRSGTASSPPSKTTAGMRARQARSWTGRSTSSPPPSTT
jgi:hypothetical protein